MVSAVAVTCRGPLKVAMEADSNAARIAGRRSGRLMCGATCFFFPQAC